MSEVQPPDFGQSGGPGPSVAELLSANEGLGAAVVDIGMALGMTRPTAQNHWTAREVQNRAEDMWTQVLHAKALRMALRMLLERGPWASDTTLTIYGPGDQEIVDWVRRLLELPGAGPPPRGGGNPLFEPTTRETVADYASGQRRPG